MGERIRAFDWSATAVGPIEAWSPALLAVLRIILVNRVPHILWWGPDYIQFYNDTYAPILGAKHPDQALGRPCSESWSGIWQQVRPILDAAFHDGSPTSARDLLLEPNRHGFVEETYFTSTCSPVLDETAEGGIGGVLATVTEITGTILSERRRATVLNLAAPSAEARSAEQACLISAEALALNNRDFPFALLYLIDSDGRHARLASVSGVSAGQPISPQTIALQDGQAASAWPLGEAIRSQATRIETDLASRFDGQVPPGPWSDPPHTAAILPIRSRRAGSLAGFLVAGISARLQFDDRYRDFLELVSAQIASAIAKAREHEEEKKRAEALAEIERAKTAFFSNISDGFRTPLTLMLGPIEELLTRSHTQLPPAAAGQLELAHRNSIRLLRLVNTLLDFSRLEGGRIDAVFEPTDLAAFTAEFSGVFRAAAERAGLKFTVDCPGLPEPVYVDRDMWQKIVLNLVSNALNFTTEGEIAVALRAEPSRFPDQRATLVLSVRDTGVGISAEEMSRLFKPFYRGEAAMSLAPEGSGIGLALVKDLAALHGGSVRVESRQGEGSTFFVAVPFGKEHLPAHRVGSGRALEATATGVSPFIEEALRWWQPEKPSLMEAVQEPGTPQRPFAPLPPQVDECRPRVLIADSNADMRGFLAGLLADRYRVQTVVDGQAALEAARQNRPDLVLSDVMMPRLDGAGLVRELRADPALAALPVILLSAPAGENSPVEGMQTYADDYLVKPFSARELKARVAARLEAARQRREAADQIRQSEERFKLCMEAMNDGLWDWRLPSDEHYFSPAYYRMLGYSPDAFPSTGDAWLNLIHPDDRVRTIRATMDCVEGRCEQSESEFRMKAADGEWRWVFDRFKCLGRDDRGTAVRLLGTHVDITERKRAEERLRESEERYRRLFESIDQAFCTIEVLFDEHLKPVDYRFLLVNPAFGRQTGVPDAKGRWMRDIAPLHEESWYQRFGQIALTGEPMRFESLAAQLHRYFEVFAWRIGAPEGRKVAVLLNDITGRRKTEEKLRRSEARWNSALEHLAEGVVIGTDTGHLVYWNPAARRICGLTADQGLVGLNEASDPFECWTADGARQLSVDEFPMHRILRNEVLRDVELRLRRPDQGWERIVSFSGSMVETADGERLAHISLNDLTEQRKVEEAFRRSAQQFQDLIDGSPGMVFVKDLEGRYITINTTFERFVGLSRDEVRGKTDYDLFSSEEAEAYRKHDRRAAETGAPLQVEETCDLKDGTRIVHLLNKFPIHDVDGKIYAVCGMGTDITERKQSEERLRESQKLESIGVLAGGVAHDFNNLLTGVVGNASLIQEALGPGHPASELADRILETGEQLAHLTRQMLAYAGKGRFILEPLNLSVMARDLGELLRSSIPKKVALHFDLEKDLPAIEADRGQAQQILLNLVINAGEAIGNRDGLITVKTLTRTVDIPYIRIHPEAAALSPGEYVVLEVRDTGCGIDDAVKTKIFDPFFSTKFTGRGLGLAAVAGIVRGHKGAIIVNSQPGTGTTFDVLLPAIPRPIQTQPEAPPVVKTEGSGVVLIIDDEPTVRQIAKKALENRGYTVLVADDGLAAIDIFKRHPGKIDLAILDLSMPGMSGQETLPELRKVRPDVKVLVSSGYSEIEAMTMFEGQKVSGFIQKPYTSARIADTVKLVLS
jgi:PAS domain S-box-containing protein